MQTFPHVYSVDAVGTLDGDIELRAARLPVLRSASPAEFGGPGDRWSPETFLVGAVADCFVLTFRAVARASNLPWMSLQCHVIGTLDRVDRVTQFTAFELHAHLRVAPGLNPDVARRALEKAEHNCLISSSLKAAVHLVPEIEVCAVSTAEELVPA